MLNTAILQNVWVWGNYINSFAVNRVPDKFSKKGANASSETQGLLIGMMQYF